MIKDELFSTYIQEKNQTFSGWDFSYLSETGRVQNGILSWSYGSIVLPLIKEAQAMLDMGTGGGEFLSMLTPYPPTICATEAYPPNVPIAKKRLEPLGVKIVQIDDDNELPFEDNSFDLIINRHESYSPTELKRILTNQGIFLTQQVGGTDCSQINEQLGAPLNEEFNHWNMRYAINELEDHGFKIIDHREEFPMQRFYDIGALIYYLKAIPWQVPDFTIEKYQDRLYQIHKIIQSKGYFDVQQSRFLIKAVLE
ncbi:class I SAM-dependent methyltransferase [Heyndrickxia oleronia]|uniref:class I SAM-dependent methyltransferase n=1 Tax=Heyndrickxia oleronia TaxID=38875 RepID=UPI0033383AE0